MTHVSNIDNVFYIVPIKFEGSAQRIFKQIGTQVPDVGIVVNRRSTSINSDAIS
jgi:hypothetical protein